MSPHFNEWLELALRWAHVFAGILWVGATFYFTWLDGCFEELAKDVGRGFSAFDLVCHVAFDQPPLTRKQRASKVRTWSSCLSTRSAGLSHWVRSSSRNMHHI